MTHSAWAQCDAYQLGPVFLWLFPPFAFSVPDEAESAVFETISAVLSSRRPASPCYSRSLVILVQRKANVRIQCAHVPATFTAWCP